MITISIRGRPLERIEQRRNEPSSGRADDPESDMAADFVAERCQIVFDRSEFADDSAGSIGNDLTLGGEFASGPVDQGRAEFGLESGEMGRNDGLHGVQGPSGRRERTVFGDGEQRVQLAKVHRCE